MSTSAPSTSRPSPSSWPTSARPSRTRSRSPQWTSSSAKPRRSRPRNPTPSTRGSIDEIIARRAHCAPDVTGGIAMHLGLIGGIGPAATEYYYRGLVDRHARADTALELTIAHADVRELARNAAHGDAARQAETFAGLVRRLAAAGAQAAAVTSMGGHFCIRALVALSPLPIINAIPEVDAAIARAKLKTV